MDKRTASIDNYFTKGYMNLPLTSCMEKRIYGGTCENKLVLRHSGKPFRSITDVTGNDGKTQLNINENMYLNLNNFCYLCISLTFLMSMIIQRD